MEIFLTILSYFLILGISIFSLIQIILVRKKVKTLKTEIDAIEAEAYTKLRDLQYKSKDVTKLADKLVKQKKSILTDVISNLLIMLLPFKKLKTILLLRKFLKGVNSGFTFAELMISLVVISILAAVLYPNLMHFLPNSNKPLFKAAYKTLGNALAEITTAKKDGKLQTGTVSGISSSQQLCIDFCNKANIVPENNSSACTAADICNDSKLTTTNGMRWGFENFNADGYPTLEYHDPAVDNKPSFRITVDVNPSNSSLNSTPAASRCTLGISFSADGNANNKGIFCYNHDAIYSTKPSDININGVFNLDNAKAQDTFQFLVDEKGKIISISPAGWAILEDNSQLD